MSKINLIKRSDYNRILITETLPYETPIIFSNDGLYSRLLNFEAEDEIQKTLLQALVLSVGLPKNVSATIPYHYKIKKTSTEFRRLALLHPRSQWRVKCFYEKYEKLILHYCSLSPASIRAPNSVAGSFYNKSAWENVNKYKNGGVALSAVDRYAKHTPSFFAYRGYDRLYKFFNSKDYFSLEKKFEVLLTLDVSKCFDSIYTHSLSWAVKDKQFTKNNIDVSSTFAQEFDAVIRHGNHNETHGIPIGPEVSRVFSEILFQEIDRQVIARLQKKSFNVDYAFRRYVDDVFIFAKDDKIARLVYESYADVLVAFSLHANTGKSMRLARPFLTKKSRLINEASQKTNEFIDKFLVQKGGSLLQPKKVYSPWKLTKSYIDSIKTLCSHNSADYDEVASFLVAIITERVKKIVANDLPATEKEFQQEYLSALYVLLDVLFFFYSVSPSVSASYKLSTSLILAIRFVRKNIPKHTASMSQRIYDLTVTLLADESGKPDAEGVDGFIRLECLNIVLAIRELGDHYLLPETIIDELFVRSREMSYFTMVSCLFYIKADSRYSKLRLKIVAAISEKLSDLSDVLGNSEKAYLLLDMFSCPFITDKKKKDWSQAFHRLLSKPAPTTVQWNGFLANSAQGHWQVNWSDVDLLNSLEKKELKQAY
ncbi:MAG: RNA-directed DNA polymerase [Polaromonas sp.]|uniref:antiviral reverse transcriptase Drt3b n=1 Tax=Polaromonas sp. TaxID=1869339 RepID=UPI00248807CE|nr:antiviral reverse transcriptase Drt3b [Polaromonas sp.]MDI1270617.1 RNA-directed DNA polymerase [Polaromonas sp.]